MSFVIVSSLGRLEQPIEKLSSAPTTTREVADGKDLRISSSPGAIFEEGAFQRNVRPVLVHVKRRGRSLQPSEEYAKVPAIYVQRPSPHDLRKEGVRDPRVLRGVPGPARFEGL